MDYKFITLAVILIVLFILAIHYRWFRKDGSISDYLKAKCGHQTKRKGSIYDEDKEKGPYEVEFTTEEPDFCLDCLRRSVIKCPWCNGPIFPGEPITLYSPEKDFKIPDGAVVFSKELLQFVGCGRCADTGADYSGFWIMPGKVVRKKSLIEIAAETGSAVMSNNVSGLEESDVMVFRKGEDGKPDKWVPYSREFTTP